MGVLMHEFYHIIFEHVTTRKPEGGIRRIDNIAMDLAINGLSEMRGKLPCEADPGPVLTEGGEPMKGCLPGEGKFADLPSDQTYEWYLAESGKDAGRSQAEWRRTPLGRRIPSMSTMVSARAVATRQPTRSPKERLKEAVKKAAEEADKAGSTGALYPQSMKKTIKDRLQTKVDWKKMLRYFVRTSQRADKRSTPRRLNKRFPKIHPGKRVRRQAKIAISIDQSGSVDDGMLAAFYSELDNLAQFAEFTVMPFDTQRSPRTRCMCGRRVSAASAERVMCGGTCFDAPTKLRQ